MHRQRGRCRDADTAKRLIEGGYDAGDVRRRDKDGFVIFVGRAKPSEDALRRYALDNGPGCAHPRAVSFVDELPLAGTNRIDRRTLVERAAFLFAREDQRRECCV
jgi:acyl-coenzyme A synthetase/AMP-(fatty) acid ligase